MVSVNATSILSTLITANHVLHYHSEPRECLHILFCQNLSASAHLIYQHINELNVADASQTDPTRPRSFFERFIHSEIYKRFEDVNSVLHSHSPEVLPYTITDVPLKAVYHMPGFLGDHGVPNFDIAEFYEPGDQQDLLIAGFAVAGETIEQAVFFSSYTQRNAEIQSSAIELEHALVNTGERRGLRYLTLQEGRDAWATNKPLIVRAWELWQREVETMGQGLYGNGLEQ